jgi:hypothetical protein
MYNMASPLISLSHFSTGRKLLIPLTPSTVIIFHHRTISIQQESTSFQFPSDRGLSLSPSLDCLCLREALAGASQHRRNHLYENENISEMLKKRNKGDVQE